MQKGKPVTTGNTSRWTSGSITRKRNIVEVIGPLDDFHRFLSLIYTAIEKKRYSDIVLNLKQCTTAYQNTMLSLCAQIMAYRKADLSGFLKKNIS